jgi:peptidyl-prolyl cis-trans isomerase C
MTLAVSACSKGAPAAASANDAVKPTEQTTQAAPPVKPVPAQLPDVVARVNGETINKTEFETAIKNLEGRAGGAVPADQRDRVYRGVLDQLIAYRLLTQESKSRNVVVPEAEVDARLSQIRQQFPSEDAFKQTLAQQGMTLDKLREDARSDMRVSKMLQDEVATKVALQAGEVNHFYEKNPDKFKQGERVRASHILIRVPENADAAAKEQAKSKATDVLKQVKSGQDFAQLAKTHSQDPGSAPGGGDLGYFMQGQMVGAFERAAFGMKPGEVSELVETPFGFHIIKVADKQAARTMPIDEVRPQIEQFLQNQQRMEKTQAFVDTLKAKGKVEIFI